MARAHVSLSPRCVVDLLVANARRLSTKLTNHHGKATGTRLPTIPAPPNKNNHTGSSRSAHDEANPYSAEKFDLLIGHWLVTCCPLGTVSIAFSFEQGSDHSREIGCVYADAASLTESSILKAQCEG